MNGYLLDTNVPSEFSRDHPEPRVVKWLKVQPVTALFLSVITIGEIRKGLVVAPQGRRRADLETWFHTELACVVSESRFAGDTRYCRSLG